VLDHVGLSVADLDSQSRWYAAAFDLRVATPFELPTLGLRGVFVVHQSGWAIELLERAGSTAHRPAAADPNEALLRRGFGHICLRVPDVDAAHDRLLAVGATQKMAPRQSPEPGVRMAYVADPEGNLIELIDRAYGPGDY